jgi:F-type H+-transporting ATPase subunit b
MSPPNASLILIMVCFWVTFWLVQRYLIRPIWGVVSDRKGRVDSAQQAWKAKNEEYLSATARLEAELEEASREAARVRAELRQKAQEERQQRVARARAEADARLEAALDVLRGDAEAARAELRGRADELARMLAGQLLGREVKL